ncbi:hypothetical protein BVC80_8889g20 [Macleaya cordata]|uniref:Bulb-type lectin domain n=1 Tax=Macleaya cordata TaxID=56857 RepID=A0A200Q761_MACCD|nr:hypothetical protein BVC80_8889g20 [Macleaya cordata]
MESLINVLLLIFISSSLFFLSQALTPAGTIERVTKQQLLASIPPSHEPTPTGSSQLFLTSPSGKYGVFLVRRETSIGAGGFGSDFCYIQVQDSGISVWESECTPVSNVNTCSLMFSDAGLEIFDGSRSAWDGDVDGEDLETLELLDIGDMRIRDKDGEQVWKASDNPIVNQNCGSIGAPGLAPALPPFASPIHGDDDQGPFGQPAPVVTTTPVVNNVNPGLPTAAAAPGLAAAAPGVAADEEQQQQQQELDNPKQGLSNHPLSAGLNQPYSNSLNQPFGGAAGAAVNQQPLLDNTPFDSGCSREKALNFGVALVITVLGCLGFIF